MRLFLAVDVSEGARRDVRGVMRLLAKRGRRDPLDDPGLSWVSEYALHVTVHFLGETAAERISSLVAALAPPLAVVPFALTFGMLGYFPSSGRARVVWLDVLEQGDSLMQLHEQLGSRLGALGLDTEPRPFRPHLTIARISGHADLLLRSRLSSVHLPIVQKSFVDHVTLYESRPTEEGHRYLPLLRTPLGGSMALDPCS